MTVKEIVESILKRHSVKKSTLATRLGVTRQSLNSRFNANGGTVRSLVETTRVLNYKVVVMPAETKVRSDWYEVTEE